MKHSSPIFVTFVRKVAKFNKFPGMMFKFVSGGKEKLSRNGESDKPNPIDFCINEILLVFSLKLFSLIENRLSERSEIKIIIRVFI